MKACEIFLGVNMSSQHDGLADHAKRCGVELSKMPAGTAAVFINKAKTRIKTVTWNGVLGYIRALDPRRPFDLSSIDMFPRAFSPDGHMDYDAALKLKLEQQLTTHKFFKDTLYITGSGTMKTLKAVTTREEAVKLAKGEAARHTARKHQGTRGASVAKNQKSRDKAGANARSAGKTAKAPTR